MGYLALPYPIQQLRVGEVSTESKLFTVPCDGDVELDCSCVPDESAASSGNSSSSFSETINSIFLTVFTRVSKYTKSLRSQTIPHVINLGFQSYGLVNVNNKVLI